MEAPRGVEPTGTNGRKATLIFPDPFGDRIILLQTTPDGNEHCLATRRNINGIASPIRFPGRHKAGRPQRLTVQEKICGGHGPGETPGPIPNPEAKAWHGDGTAPDRVWESSTPPHHTYRKPLGAHAPRGFPYIRNRPRPEPARAPGPPRIPMRPTPGTIPGQPRRRGRTARRVRDRGSPTPGPPVRRADSSPPEGSQKLAWLWGRSTLASAMHYFTPKRCATSNKIMYHDKAQAQRAADQSLIERGAELWVYRCEYCGCWHLTHRDPQSSYRHVPLNQQLKPHSRKKGYKPRRR